MAASAQRSANPKGSLPPAWQPQRNLALSHSGRAMATTATGCHPRVFSRYRRWRSRRRSCVPRQKLSWRSATTGSRGWRRARGSESVRLRRSVAGWRMRGSCSRTHKGWVSVHTATWAALHGRRIHHAGGHRGHPPRVRRAVSVPKKSRCTNRTMPVQAP
eukprot:358964-Chlamydomonas_euryale.AAC.2